MAKIELNQKVRTICDIPVSHGGPNDEVFRAGLEGRIVEIDSDEEHSVFIIHVAADEFGPELFIPAYVDEFVLVD